MPAQCWSSVGGCRLRVTRLDSCGRPVPPGTEDAYAVTKGFTTVTYSPEISEGEDVELRNACNEICVSEPGCDELRYVSVSITFCGVDPAVFSIISGQEMVLDYKGDPVGNRIAGKISCQEGYALELWSRIPNKQCDPDAVDGQYGYFLLPYVASGVIGEWSVEAATAMTFTFTGKTRAGSGWGVGPWDVDQHDEAGTAGPLLTPIGENDHVDLHLTTIAPPEPFCGTAPMPDYDLGDQS